MCSYSSRMFKVKMERSDSCVMSTGVDEVAHSSGAFGTRGNLDLGPMVYSGLPVRGTAPFGTLLFAHLFQVCTW
jgi:hypothetical protein